MFEKTNGYVISIQDEIHTSVYTRMKNQPRKKAQTTSADG